ncbi:unnamed protein product [Parajaminaea phylloscopi]
MQDHPGKATEGAADSTISPFTPTFSGQMDVRHKLAEYGLNAPQATGDKLQLCTINLGWIGSKYLWGHLKPRGRRTPRDPLAEVDEPSKDSRRREQAQQAFVPDIEGRVNIGAALLNALMVLPHFVSDPASPQCNMFWANLCTQPRLLQQGFDAGIDAVIKFLREQLAVHGVESPRTEAQCCKLIGGYNLSAPYLAVNHLWRLDTLEAATTGSCLSVAKATASSQLELFTLALRFEEQSQQWTVAVGSTPYLDHFLRTEALSADHMTVILAAALLAKNKVRRAKRQERCPVPKDFSLDPSWLSGPNETLIGEASVTDGATLKQMLWPEHRPCLEQSVPLASDLLEDRAKAAQVGQQERGSHEDLDHGQHVVQPGETGQVDDLQALFGAPDAEGEPAARAGDGVSTPTLPRGRRPEGSARSGACTPTPPAKPLPAQTELDGPTSAEHNVDCVLQMAADALFRLQITGTDQPQTA